MNRLVPKYLKANKGKIGYHLERDINGNYVWVPNNKVGAEHAIAYSQPTSGTIQRTAPTKRLSQNALRHGDERRTLQRAEELEKKALKGDLLAAAELGAMKGPDEIKATDPFSDETTLASERALYYWDPIRGLSLRWNTSLDNDTNPIKALANNPIAYGNPVTAAAASTYHLASDNGIRKTYDLAKSGLYDRALMSGIGDVFDASMLLHLPRGINGMARQFIEDSNAGIATPKIQHITADVSASRPFVNESAEVKTLPSIKGLSDLEATDAVKKANEQAIKDLNYKGNFSRASLLYNLTDPNGIKLTWDVTKKNPFSLRNYKFLTDQRLSNDLIQYDKGVLNLRSQGLYPLTFGERRLFVKGAVDDVRKGINFVKEESEVNPNVTGLSSREDVEYAKSLRKKLDDGSIPFDELNQANDEYNAMIPDWRHQRNLDKLQNAQNTARFGTRISVNRYGAGRDVSPSLNEYQAFELNGTTYYPFRDRFNTLNISDMFRNLGSRILVGGHEYEHTVLKMHETPLTVYDPQIPGEYGRYTNPNLNFGLYYPAQDIVWTAGTSGLWEGSLSEMDSELKGWRAEHDLPKYSKMTPEWLQYIIDKANLRFRVPSDYTLSAAKKASEALDYPVDDYIKSTLENQRFHKLFTQLEKQGYKTGGKLIKRK